MDFIDLQTTDDQKGLLRCLWEQFEEGAHCDCRLVAEGKFIDVNSAILSAASSYFKSILSFARDNKRDPIMIFETLSFDNLMQMTRYVYKGKVTIEESQLPSFLQTLRHFKIGEPEKTPVASVTAVSRSKESVVNIPKVQESDDESDDRLIFKEEPEKLANAECMENVETDIADEEKEELTSMIKLRRVTNFTTTSKVAENLKQSVKGDTFLSKSLPVTKSRNSSFNIARTNVRTPEYRKNVKDRFIKTSSENRLGYKCIFCSSLTKTAKLRLRHQRFCKLNPSREVNICPICGGEYSRSDGLRIHMLKCSSKKEDA